MSSWLWGVVLLIMMASVVTLIIGVGAFMGQILRADSGMESFECGFECMGSARSSFSIKFYLIVIMFLVFDAEIMIILPLPNAMEIGLCTEWYVLMCSVWGILLLGIVVEWLEGSFEWVY